MSTILLAKKFTGWELCVCLWIKQKLNNKLRRFSLCYVSPFTKWYHISPQVTALEKAARCTFYYLLCSLRQTFVCYK